MTTGYRDKATNEIIEDISDKTELAKFPPSKFSKEYEIASVTMDDISEIHTNACPNKTCTVDMSLDGVSECKSNGISLDVYTTRFDGCRTIYPLTIVRPINKSQLNHREIFDNLLKQVTDKHTLSHFISDNLKRAFVRDSMCHSAKFACEYCFQSGTPLRNVQPSKSVENQIRLISDQIAELSKQNSDLNRATIKVLKEDIKLIQNSKPRAPTNIVWPAETRNGESRTVAKIKEITNEIRASNLPSSKGIFNHSTLLDLDNFNFVKDVPAEYMHSVCIGSVSYTHLTLPTIYSV